MRILVTNDDGWDAPGLAALKTLAGQIGDVYVLAPRDPHSYAGHRVTTDGPLVLTETGAREFTLSGTPADCVRVAIATLFPEIDWVLAGINRGGNLGADLFTSGTVAAAREAALLGRPAIAVSQVHPPGHGRGLGLGADAGLAGGRTVDQGGVSGQELLERESSAHGNGCRRGRGSMRS